MEVHAMAMPQPGNQIGISDMNYAIFLPANNWQLGYNDTRLRYISSGNGSFNGGQISCGQLQGKGTALCQVTCGTNGNSWGWFVSGSQYGSALAWGTPATAGGGVWQTPSGNVGVKSYSWSANDVLIIFNDGTTNPGNPNTNCYIKDSNFQLIYNLGGGVLGSYAGIFFYTYPTSTNVFGGAGTIRYMASSM
jgi:hypothetical protein